MLSKFLKVRIMVIKKKKSSFALKLGYSMMVLQQNFQCVSWTLITLHTLTLSTSPRYFGRWFPHSVEISRRVDHTQMCAACRILAVCWVVGSKSTSARLMHFSWLHFELQWRTNSMSLASQSKEDSFVFCFVLDILYAFWDFLNSF